MYQKAKLLFNLARHEKVIRGQSYKKLQISKCILKHLGNVSTQNILNYNFRTLQPNLFAGLYFSSRLNRQFRYFILHHPEFKKVKLNWRQVLWILWVQLVHLVSCNLPFGVLLGKQNLI